MTNVQRSFGISETEQETFLPDENTQARLQSNVFEV